MPKQEVTPVAIANDEKVKVTKANYQSVMARAKTIQATMRQSLEDTGGFPSHNYFRKELGFNVSYKALINHRRRVEAQMTEDEKLSLVEKFDLTVEDDGTIKWPTTSAIARKKKPVEQAEPVAEEAQPPVNPKTGKPYGKDTKAYKAWLESQD